MMVKKTILALLLGFLGQIYACDRTGTPSSFASTSTDSSDSEGSGNNKITKSDDKVTKSTSRINCCQRLGDLTSEACYLPIRLFIWSTGPKWVDKNH